MLVATYLDAILLCGSHTDYNAIKGCDACAEMCESCLLGGKILILRIQVTLKLTSISVSTLASCGAVLDVHVEYWYGEVLAIHTIFSVGLGVHETVRSRSSGYNKRNCVGSARHPYRST